jgi:hypothetical protein
MNSASAGIRIFRNSEVADVTLSRSLIVLGFAVGSLPLVRGAMAGGPFDGHYTGYQRVTKSDNGGHCQNQNRDNVGTRVRDGAIEWTWGGVPLKATVAPDGSFSVTAAGWASSGGSGAYSFTGRITAGNLEGDVGGANCAVHLSLKKS